MIKIKMQAIVKKSSELPHYRCILWGGYAWGNVGDELTLAVAVRDMQRRFGHSVAILTRSPGYTRRLFPDCDAIAYEPVLGNQSSDYDVEEQLSSTTWAKQIAACENLYLVGGGYLSDLFCVNWLLLPVFVARSCGVSVSMAPIGLGPFSSEWWANRVAEALRKSTTVVRDDASVAYCRQSGLPVKRREDDGFRLAEVVEFARPDQTPKFGAKRIGVNIFNQFGSSRHHESKAWWTDLLEHLSAANVVIEGFCFHNSIFDDFAVTSECFDRAGLDPSNVRSPDIDFRVACAQLANYDAVASSRFHAIVVGNAIGIPTFAVCDGDYYCRKMEAAVHKFDSSTLVRQFDAPPQEIAARILNAANSLTKRRTGLRLAVHRCQQALRNLRPVSTISDTVKRWTQRAA